MERELKEGETEGGQKKVKARKTDRQTDRK